MKIIRIILITIYLLLAINVAKAQQIERFNSFSYNVNEGLLQSNVLDIAFDKNNFCWLAFANGIQKFDGKNFISIPVQPGLADNKWVNFFRCNNGDLLISHVAGISRYEISNNRFIELYKTKPNTKKPPLFIGEDGSSIYFFSYEGIITGLDTRSYKKTSETDMELGTSISDKVPNIKLSDNIIDQKIAMILNSTLCLWDLEKRKFLYRSKPIENIFYYALTLKSATEVFYYAYKDGNISMLQYDFVNESSQIMARKKQIVPAMSFRSVAYSWNKKKLFSYSNHLYETSPDLQEIKTELVNFQNKALGGSSPIAKIKEDNFGNLYLVTISDGFKKILKNAYPIKYYGAAIKEHNYILSLLTDKKNNRILAGTYGKGLLVFDSSQKLIKHIEQLPGDTIGFSPTAMVKTDAGDYMLFILFQKKAWVLSKDLSRFESIGINSLLPENKQGVKYFGKPLFQNEREAVVLSQNSLYHAKFNEKKINEHSFSTTATMSGLWYEPYIISHSSDELIFLDAASFNEIKRISFKHTGEVRCFAKDGSNIYIGSNKGIFKIDINGKILSHFTRETGLPDECIYSIEIDNEGLLWCSTNKGIFKINKDNSVLQLTKDDGLQENEFNTNVSGKTEDGEIFFAGVNGISSFFPWSINSFEDKLNLIFSSIKINNEELYKDSAAWSIDKIDLKYDQNALSFDFIAMGENNPGQYIYQYQMEGVDKEWIRNTDMQTVRYFLQPGKYVFKIYASRFFNKDAAPLKEIVINIAPPIWKTWWFRLIASIMATLALAYAINQFNRQKYLKKMAELESEHKIQLERERISRDLHDSIGAYANAVLYKTDLLQNEEIISERNELMNDLKFASKDIITSLRETIWALKKEEYTAQDCLLRIRNFIQPFNSYYPGIQFSVDGEAPASMKLNSTKALNLVRIVQEAVTNAIKHAGAVNITISSSIETDTWKLSIADNGKGFDYEGISKLKQGNGLDNMLQRALDGGFKFTLQSSEKTGTCITLLV